MRKVLSFVLVLALVLGSFSMAFAAAPSDVVGTDSEEAVTVLTELGVVTGYADGTYKPEGIVTRAEMATLLVKALGLADYVTATASSSFTDMAGYGWAQGYIAYAQSLGLVKGYGDGTFKPGATVSYDEAATMIVRALGYTDVSLPGTWPANYVVKAKALDILKGIQAGPAGANRGDIAQMLYAALDEAIGTVNADDEFIPTADDTMLARLGAEMYEPADPLYDVDEDGYAFVLTPDIANDETADGVNVGAYVGAVVSAYANDDGEILAIKSVHTTFLKGNYSTNGKFDVDGTVYTVDAGNFGVEYQYEDTAAGASATGAALFLVNGDEDDGVGNTAVSFATTTKGITIAADVSGKKISEVYSLSRWSGTNFQFDEDNAEEITEDMALNGKDFAENDDEEIDLASFQLLGVDALEDIDEDAIVTVYTATPNDSDEVIVKVEASTKTVEGKVTKKGGDPVKYTIDGTGYEAVTLISGSDTLDVGTEGTFFLNYGGKIAKVEGTSSAGNYAMVLGTATVKEGNFVDDIWQTKLLTKEGDEVVFDFDKDYTTTSAAIKDTPVAIDTNKDGELTDVDAVTLHAIGSGGELSEKGILDGNLVADNVVVFYQDEDGDWVLGDLGDIQTDEDLSGEVVYAVNTDGDVDLIVATNAATATTKTYGVITGKADAVDADDDDAFLITAIIDGAKTDYYTDGTGSKVNFSGKDTLYKFSFDGDIIKEVTKAAVSTAAASNTNVQTNDMSGFATVTAMSGDKVKVNGSFELIEGATVYYATFKADGSFNGYAVGKASDVSENSKVQLFYTDEDSDNWDLVFVIKRGDVAKADALGAGYFNLAN